MQMNNETNETCLTFGVRLLRFLEDMYPEMGQTHIMIQEEYEFLCGEACGEIKRKHANPENDYYFKNIVKDHTDWKDFIEKSYDAKFVKFLKVIKCL